MIGGENKTMSGTKHDPSNPHCFCLGCVADMDARSRPTSPAHLVLTDEVSQPVRVSLVGPDPEVEAIRSTCAALEALPDPQARRRVLAWAQARFTTEAPWPQPLPKKS